MVQSEENMSLKIQWHHRVSILGPSD